MYYGVQYSMQSYLHSPLSIGLNVGMLIEWFAGVLDFYDGGLIALQRSQSNSRSKYPPLNVAWTTPVMLIKLNSTSFSVPPFLVWCRTIPDLEVGWMHKDWTSSIYRLLTAYYLYVMDNDQSLIFSIINVMNNIINVRS